MDSITKRSAIILIVIIYLFSLSVGTSNASPAADTDIYADRDTWVNSFYPDQSYGTLSDLYAGTGASLTQLYHSYLHFDISSCQGISAATLYLYCSLTLYGDFTLNIHIVNGTWAEDIDYTERPVSFSAINTTILASPGWCSVSITAIAQDWETGKLDNFGVLLEADTTDNFAVFNSREHGSNRPYLAITATSVPEGNPIILFTPAALCIMCCLIYYKKRID